MLHNPCFGCTPPQRTAECHGVCPKYIKFEKENLERRTKYAKSMEVDFYIRDNAGKHEHIMATKRRSSK